MLTVNIKRNVQGAPSDTFNERILEAKEVYTRWEYIEPALVNPPMPSQVVVVIDSNDTHHEILNGFVYVMNTHGKTVAAYILGERMGEVGHV